MAQAFGVSNKQTYSTQSKQNISFHRHFTNRDPPRSVETHPIQPPVTQVYICSLVTRLEKKKVSDGWGVKY